MKLLLASLLLASGSTYALDATLISANANPMNAEAGKKVAFYAAMKSTTATSALTGSFVLIGPDGKEVLRMPAEVKGQESGDKAMYTAVTLPNMVSGKYSLKIDLSDINAKAASASQLLTPAKPIVLDVKGSKAPPVTEPSTPVGNPPAGNPPATNPPSTSSTKPASNPLGLDMKMTFNDDFNGALDRNVWTPGMANAGVANSGEIQWFTPDEVTTLPNGVLRLSTSKRNFEGKKITAGAVTSAEGFAQTYGHFEMRAKMAGGPGTWPAFWLLANDNTWPPEIDIFEYLGRLPTTQHVGYFSLKNGKKVSYGNYTPKQESDLSKGFHVYAVDWRPEMMVFSIDGKEVFRDTKADIIPNKPMYMLANIAMGGSWAGPVTDATPFPGIMDIDYIRVFQYPDMKAEPVRFMQLGKSQLDKRKAKAGDELTITSSVKVNADMKSLTAYATLTPFTNTTALQTAHIKLGDVVAGKNVPMTFKLKLPENLADGIYNIKVAVIGSNAVMDPVTKKALNQVFRGLADQVVVGNPLPPTDAEKTKTK